MTAEFDWWLLIVGLVVGAGVVWLVLADWSRQEEDIAEAELSVEAEVIASHLAELGYPVDAATAHEVLREHRAYLAGPPLNSIEAAERDGEVRQISKDGSPSQTEPRSPGTEQPSETEHPTAEQAGD